MHPDIVGVSLFGILAALMSAMCMYGRRGRHADTKIFGKIHWSIIGTIGYILIIMSTMQEYVPWATLALGITAGMVTIWLVIRSVQLKLFCPGCILTWMVNAAILVMAFVPETGHSMVIF